LRIRDICRTPLAYSPGTMSIERRIVLALIKVRRERGKRCRIGDRRGLDSIMGGDFAFDLRHARECFVPARFQFAGHQPVGRNGGIVLSEGAIGCVARRFQIALECFAHLIARLAGLSLKARCASTRPFPATVKVR